VVPRGHDHTTARPGRRKVHKLFCLLGATSGIQAQQTILLPPSRDGSCGTALSGLVHYAEGMPVSNSTRQQMHADIVSVRGKRSCFSMLNEARRVHTELPTAEGRVRGPCPGPCCQYKEKPIKRKLDVLVGRPLWGEHEIGFGGERNPQRVRECVVDLGAVTRTFRHRCI
jgi:hypothetical protein